jgi:hypothetical protein
MLADRTAVMIGSTSEPGRTISRRLSVEGATLVLLGVDRESAFQLAQELGAPEGEVLPLPGNHLDSAEVVGRPSDITVVCDDVPSDADASYAPPRELPPGRRSGTVVRVRSGGAVIHVQGGHDVDPVQRIELGQAEASPVVAADVIVEHVLRGVPWRAMPLGSPELTSPLSRLVIKRMSAFRAGALETMLSCYAPGARFVRNGHGFDMTQVRDTVSHVPRLVRHIRFDYGLRDVEDGVVEMEYTFASRATGTVVVKGVDRFHGDGTSIHLLESGFEQVDEEFQRIMREARWVGSA